MKSSRGFTLIELLIVIAIIGILMALLFPAVQSAIDTARRTQAKNDVTQIATAVVAYTTEYGRLPYTNSGGQNIVVSSNTFLPALLGTDSNMNPRGLVFLEVNNVGAKSHKSGILTNTDPSYSGSSGDFVDPWGAPYIASFDVNYTNGVTITYSNSSIPVRKTVAVCSKGGWADGAATNKTVRRWVSSWE